MATGLAALLTLAAVNPERLIASQNVAAQLGPDTDGWQDWNASRAAESQLTNIPVKC